MDEKTIRVRVVETRDIEGHKFTHFEAMVQPTAGAKVGDEFDMILRPISKPPKRRQWVFTETEEKGAPKKGQSYIGMDGYPQVASTDYKCQDFSLLKLEIREVDA